MRCPEAASGRRLVVAMVSIPRIELAHVNGKEWANGKHAREIALQLLLPPMTTGPPGASIEASQFAPSGSAGDSYRPVCESVSY